MKSYLYAGFVAFVSLVVVRLTEFVLYAAPTSYFDYNWFYVQWPDVVVCIGALYLTKQLSLEKPVHSAIALIIWTVVVGIGFKFLFFKTSPALAAFKYEDVIVYDALTWLCIALPPAYALRKWLVRIDPPASHVPAGHAESES